MRGRSTAALTVGVGLLAASALAACGRSAVSDAAALAVGHHLAAEVVPAPPGYGVDPDPGVNGRITPAAFDAIASGGSASSAGFRGGFKGTYLDSASHEGIVVTLLEFDSAADADRYLRTTAAHTLSAYAPTETGVADPPGGRRFDGTRPFDDDWAHGVIDTRGAVYMSLVYLASGAGPAPFEFTGWVKKQYELLG